MNLSGLFANRYYLMKGSAREGGTATVYKAIDELANNTQVAVKVFKDTAHEAPFLHQMFYNEVEALSRLKHPNIVQLLDSGIDEAMQCYYVVLEWVESSLAQWRDIYRHDLSWSDLASQVILPVLDGLTLAHARSVRHRDIKPTNILLAPDGSPKIADFGIAKIVDCLRCGVTVNQFGAKPFMPPEYFQAGVPIATPQGDLYSLGITILKVLESPNFPIGPDFLPSAATVKSAIEHLHLDKPAIEFLVKLIHPESHKRFFNAQVAYEELKAQLKLGHIKETEKLTFYLSLTYKSREHLRASHNLRSEHDIEEFILNDVREGSAIQLDTTSALARPAYDLFGQELLYRLQMPADEPHKLLVISAKTLPNADTFIKRRDRAMPITAKWLFSTPTNRVMASRDLEVLFERTQDHESSRKRENIDAEEKEMYAKWRSAIKAKRELMTSASYGFTYTSYTRKGLHITFTVSETPSEAILAEEVVWRVVAERSFVQVKIIDVVGDELLCVIQQGKPESIPHSGRIEVDTSASAIPLDRQERALNDVQNRTSRRTDLGKLLAWPDEVCPPQDVSEINVKTEKWDDAKLTALRMALGSKDIVIVQGPPGTGKTTWIAELVYQELKHAPNQKILLSAQTHIAVDNALEDILKLRPDTRAIRIGDTKNIADTVATYELSNRLAAWSEEVKQASVGWLDTSHSELDKNIPGAFLREKLQELIQAENQRMNASTDIEELRREKEQSGKTGTRTLKSESGYLKKHRELEALAASAQGKAENLRMEIASIFDDAEVLTAPLSEVDERVVAWEAQLPEKHKDEVRKYSRLKAIHSDWIMRFGTGEGFEEYLLSLADVVAGTCIGIERAFRRNALEIGFSLVIIDEASKATSTETLVPMTRGDRFAFVGDQKQLPPYVDQELLSPAVLARHNLTFEDMRETLFDRLTQMLPETCKAVLDTQYRMVPEIGRLISTCFYNGTLATGRPSSTMQWLQKFLERPIVWFSTSALENKSETRDGNSYKNLEECRRIAEWLHSLDEAVTANGARLTVGIISGYSAQVRLLSEELCVSGSEHLIPMTQWQSLDVSVNTVDAIQGREVDIVIYSITRSNAQGTIGHLRSHNRLNVALSRGKEGLILFGDIEHCYSAKDNDNPFLRLVDYIRSNPEACLEVAL